MTVKEYNQCVDDYSDNLYRFVLKNIKDISMIMFDERDVIRHHLVKQIIVAYNKLDE